MVAMNIFTTGLEIDHMPRLVSIELKEGLRYLRILNFPLIWDQELLRESKTLRF